MRLIWLISKEHDLSFAETLYSDTQKVYILTAKQILITFSIYQSREYPFSRALIGYLSSGYPALPTGFETQWTRARVITFPAEF